MSDHDYIFKIGLFGAPRESKTQLSQQFLHNLFVSDARITIGVEFEVKSVGVEGNRIKLEIWDFEEEDRFKLLLPTIVRGANGAIFDWFQLIMTEVREEDYFPIIVAGLVSGLEEDRQISTKEGIKIAKSRGLDGNIECNVKTGENIRKYIIYVMIYSNIELNIA